MSVPRLDRVERRDSKIQYNPTAIADLNTLTPAIDWNTYLKGVGFAKVDTIKKNNNKINKISFNAPVCTSG
jgi:predicted metalloendopeptidase